MFGLWKLGETQAREKRAMLTTIARLEREAADQRKLLADLRHMTRDRDHWRREAGALGIALSSMKLERDEAREILATHLKQAKLKA
jgi:hypothetical protein